MKESALEAKCCEYADKTYAVKNIKIKDKAGWPDRLFFKARQHFFVEFKREGEKPRLLQKHIHEQLSTWGEEVYVIDNFEEFKQIVRKWHDKITAKKDV